ncbi:hypothetical protein [Planctopirus hydrillae]|uniref:Peptidase MA-like domain-containing protein n=1 Tax=Planctopirus hydrillae TaxID=1841610 RepID=A0A1C3EN88_9PLAN|nr:hypothetical protein [Planctopirus hydrillae]ODA34669.1 hypothetical protein A6X21_03045 [Planctopirus hydrillae]
MDATRARIAIWAIAFLHCSLLSLAAQAASYRTPNFIVTAPTDEFARVVGEAAEEFRRDLCLSWTGREMPRWGKPCPISCKVGNYPAGGATTFNFDRGEVYGWNMEVQGTPERILDSVLPHEVNHTIFACYFRRPLPRWADEGAASLIEHESERMRLEKLAIEATGGRRKIPLRTLLGMKNYPQDQRQVLTLYAQGYLLADYLIAKSSKGEYLKFLQSAHERGWDQALQAHYGYSNVEQIEQEHDRWVLAGCPRQPTRPGEMLAGNNSQSAPELQATRTQPPASLASVASNSPGTANEPRGFSLTRPFERRSATSSNIDNLRVRGQNPETSQAAAILDRTETSDVLAAATASGNRPENSRVVQNEGYIPADPVANLRTTEIKDVAATAQEVDPRLAEARAALAAATQAMQSGPALSSSAPIKDRSQLSQPLLQQTEIPQFEPRATARVE